MKQSESGRSFVEMLGVLAVMGIISIGGLYGYTYAMKRHRTNELLNEANKRAVMVASQLMTGKDPGDVTVEESNTPYGQFNSNLEDVGDKFKMTVSGLDEETCQYMEELAGSAIRKIECKETTDGFTVEFTFNNDLSTEERASDFTTPETCKSPYKWCSGSSTCTSEESCTCSGEKPVCKVCDTTTGGYSIDEEDNTPCKTNSTLTEEDGTCQSGECVEIPTGPTCPYAGTELANTTVNGVTYSGGPAGKASDDTTDCNCPSGQVYKEDGCGQQPPSCTSWTTNECGKGYYCEFPYTYEDNYLDWNATPSWKNMNGGVCQPAPTGTPVNVKVSSSQTNTVYKYTDMMNWWSAASLCSTNHNGLITPSDLGIIDPSNNNTYSPLTMNCVCGTLYGACEGPATTGCTDGECNCFDYLKQDSVLGKPLYFWTRAPHQSDSDNSYFAAAITPRNIQGSARVFADYRALCK